jgi:hypothetical protein
MQSGGEAHSSCQPNRQDAVRPEIGRALQDTRRDLIMSRPISLGPEALYLFTPYPR